jgi:cell wall-associated NlpC family hydrolase
VNSIVAAARGWLGVRWRHQGRSRDGVDCVGLIVMVRREVFGECFDMTDYPREAVDETLREVCDTHAVRVDEPRPGDLLLMSWGHQRHIGIVGDYPFGGLSLIHAYMPARKVVETRLDEKFMARVMGVYRMPELAGEE